MNIPDVSTTGDMEVAIACPSGMVFVPGGTFRMGSDAHYQEEAPAHQVKV
ncbi:MAG: formylglycine-generating enzyme family protein, partial [Mesorhizobium sp.]